MAERTTIRKIVHQDLAELFSLGNLLFEGRELLFPWDARTVSDVLSRDEGFAFALLEKRRITGFLIAEELHTARDHRARIIWVGVQKENRGYEKKLLLAFFDEAVVRGISMVEVVAVTGDSGGAGLFSSSGFSEVKTYRLLQKSLPRGPSANEDDIRS
ncbi:MAG TPA: hypothetical protein PK926_11410 [Spirochaetota bacterium]|nr:hypothetical protein [Spirochaetota bacterium]HPI89107.1 hypothetical protein [Spirochaetota bacterium]HPR48861.1 hypothetical protein [Spirochaetota bacterium]